MNFNERRTTRDICIESCDQLLNHLKKESARWNRDAGVSVNEILDFDILGDGYVTLHTDHKMMDANGTVLEMNDRRFGEGDIRYEYFDGIHKEITIRPSHRLMELFLNSK